PAVVEIIRGCPGCDACQKDVTLCEGRLPETVLEGGESRTDKDAVVRVKLKIDQRCHPIVVKCRTVISIHILVLTSQITHFADGLQSTLTRSVIEQSLFAERPHARRIYQDIISGAT